MYNIPLNIFTCWESIQRDRSLPFLCTDSTQTVKKRNENNNKVVDIPITAPSTFIRARATKHRITHLVMISLSSSLITPSSLLRLYDLIFSYGLYNYPPTLNYPHYLHLFYDCPRVIYSFAAIPSCFCLRTDGLKGIHNFRSFLNFHKRGIKQGIKTFNLWR